MEEAGLNRARSAVSSSPVLLRANCRFLKFQRAGDWTSPPPLNPFTLTSTKLPSKGCRLVVLWPFCLKISLLQSDFCAFPSSLQVYETGKQDGDLGRQLSDTLSGGSPPRPAGTQHQRLIKRQELGILKRQELGILKLGPGWGWQLYKVKVLVLHGSLAATRTNVNWRALQLPGVS